MKTILFKDATDGQLKHYAVVMLGLNLGNNPKIKRETILARIKAAHPDKEAIEVDEDDIQPTAPKVAAKKGGAFQRSGDETTIILIDRQEGKMGSQPVPISFNGRCMLVERGKWSVIPTAFFEVLKDAVEEQYEPLDGGGIAAEPTMVPRFPFRVWEAAGDPPGLQRPPPRRGEAQLAS